MKSLKTKIAAFVTAAMIVLSAVPPVFANADSSNLSMTVDKTSLKVGETVTVTLQVSEASLATFGGGLRFDREHLLCTGIENGSGGSNLYVSAYDAELDEWSARRAMAQATVANANNKGTVGFLFLLDHAANIPIKAEGEALAVITFKAIKDGPADFSLFEDSATYPAGGECAYKADPVPGSKITIQIEADPSLNTQPNISMSVDKTSVDIGETVTATLAFTDAQLALFSGGINFDNDLFECTEISGSGGRITLLKQEGEEWVSASPDAKPTLEQANTSGSVGFSYLLSYDGNVPLKMDGDVLLKVTFMALKKGTAQFSCFEDSATYPENGANAYFAAPVPESVVIVEISDPAMADKESNLHLTVDKTDVSVGETVTVKLTADEAQLAVLAGGINFDSTAFECVRIGNGSADASDNTIPRVKAFDGENWVVTDASSYSTVAKANSSGSAGFVFQLSSGENVSCRMQYDSVFEAEFKALKTGEVAFSLYEDSATFPANGTDAYYADPVPGSEVTVKVVDKAPTLDLSLSHMCSFGNNLSIGYLAKVNDLAGYDNIKLTVSGTELTNYETITSGGTQYYRFVYTNIAAKQMGDVLTAVLYADKDGVTYQTAPDEYSVKMYAYNRLAASTNTTFKKLMVDMLNYGAAAQVYFKYDTEHLVNAELTEEQKAMGTQGALVLNPVDNTIVTEGATASFSGKNVAFSNSIQLRFYMQFAEGQSMDNIKLVISYTAADGKAVSKTIPYSEFGKYNTTTWHGTISTISAKDMSAVVTAKVYDGDVLISNIAEYSIETYVYNRLQDSTDENFKALITELMKYGKTAEEYFRAQTH